MTQFPLNAMPTFVEQLIVDFESLALDTSDASVTKLLETLAVRDAGTYEKHIVPYLACRALLSKGIIGVDALFRVLPDAPGYNYPLVILAALWYAGQGEFVEPLFAEIPDTSPLAGSIAEPTRIAAREKFVAFLDDCRTDPESFYRLINLLYQQQMRTMGDQQSSEDFHQAVFKVLSDSMFRLSERHIDRFREILAAEEREESYQSFLTENPVFLDPLASQLISKHRLGTEFITDYVLERITGEYIAVEIEKPSDPIFTKTGDFSAQFTHAFGQVLDFIEWIEQNIAYAQRKLPGIAAPKGLLVIGRRLQFTDAQTNKLRRFCKNSSSIAVLTFDDLLTNAESLQRNIRHKVGFSL